MSGQGINEQETSRTAGNGDYKTFCDPNETAFCPLILGAYLVIVSIRQGRRTPREFLTVQEKKVIRLGISVYSILHPFFFFFYLLGTRGDVICLSRRRPLDLLLLRNGPAQSR